MGNSIPPNACCLNAVENSRSCITKTNGKRKYSGMACITTLNSSPFAVFTSLRYDPIFEGHGGDDEALPVRFPKQFFLLGYHRDRLLHSVHYFHEHGAATQGIGKWDPTIVLLGNLYRFAQLVLTGVSAHIAKSGSVGPFRVRIILPISPSSPSPPQSPQPASVVQDMHLVRVECADTPPLPLSVLTALEMPLPQGDDMPESPKWSVHIDTLPTLPCPLTSHKTVFRHHYNISRERCGLPAIGMPRATNEVILYNPRSEIMEGSFTTLYFFRDGSWATPLLSSGGCEATIRRWLLERGSAFERVVRKDELKKGEWVVMSNGLRGVWGGWLV